MVQFELYCIQVQIAKRHRYQIQILSNISDINKEI